MILSVDVRDAGVLSMLADGPQKTRYAIVNALNSTMRAAQKAEQDVLMRRTHVRKDFVKRQIAVIKGANGGSGFASVSGNRYEARMMIAQKDRLLLSDLTEGGTRLPFTGRRVAVPFIGGPARPTITMSVPDTWTFRALSMRRAVKPVLTRSGKSVNRRLKTKAGESVWVGAHNTFIIQSTAKQPEGGVYQRVGPGKSDVQIVYPFVAHERLPKKLPWIETAVEVANRVFPDALRREVQASFEFAAARALRSLGH